MFHSRFPSAVVRPLSYVLLLAVCCLHTSAAVAAEEAATDSATSWKAGAAKVVITPVEPMHMAGYAARTEPAEGKIHDLYIKAVALEDAGGTRLVMITSDLIGIPWDLRKWLEEQVQEKFGLPAAGLLLNASHTHCGPEVRTTPTALYGLDPKRQERATAYVKTLQGKLLQLVKESLDDLAPARIDWCHARAGFAMNRRTLSNGQYQNRPNPDGRVDHDVPVLRVTRPDGTLRAVLFGYACHNTTLGFQQFCGDYAGFAQAAIEEAHPETVALFMMGCGGDQNPYPRRTLELAQTHGRTLATAVEAAIEATARPLEGPLKTAYETVKLEYQDHPTKEDLEKMRDNATSNYDRLHAERLLLDLEQTGRVRSSYDAPIQVIRFSDQLVFVGLPGETVVDYSLRLKRELGRKKKAAENAEAAGESAAAAERPVVWVAGYCNDVFAYIPSLRVLQEGGYEGGGAMRYFSTVVQPGPFAPSVEERIVGKVHELNDRLRGED